VVDEVQGCDLKKDGAFRKRCTLGSSVDKSKATHMTRGVAWRASEPHDFFQYYQAPPTMWLSIQAACYHNMDDGDPRNRPTFSECAPQFSRLFLDLDVNKPPRQNFKFTLQNAISFARDMNNNLREMLRVGVPGIKVAPVRQQVRVFHVNRRDEFYGYDGGMPEPWLPEDFVTDPKWQKACGETLRFQQAALVDSRDATSFEDIARAIDVLTCIIFMSVIEPGDDDNRRATYHFIWPFVAVERQVMVQPAFRPNGQQANKPRLLERLCLSKNTRECWSRETGIDVDEKGKHDETGSGAIDLLPLQLGRLRAPFCSTTDAEGRVIRPMIPAAMVMFGENVLANIHPEVVSELALNLGVGASILPDMKYCFGNDTACPVAPAMPVSRPRQGLRERECEVDLTAGYYDDDDEAPAAPCADVVPVADDTMSLDDWLGLDTEQWLCGQRKQFREVTAPLNPQKLVDRVITELFAFAANDGRANLLKADLERIIVPELNKFIAVVAWEKGPTEHCFKIPPNGSSSYPSYEFKEPKAMAETLAFGRIDLPKVAWKGVEKPKREKIDMLEIWKTSCKRLTFSRFVCVPPFLPGIRADADELNSYFGLEISAQECHEHRNDRPHTLHIERPAPYDITYKDFLQIMRFSLCNDEPAATEYLFNWVARLLQRPGEMSMVSVMFLASLQGSGKGTLIRFLQAVLGDRLCLVVRSAGVLGNFNWSLFGKMLVVFDEFDSCDGRENTWKGLVTEPDVFLTRKFHEGEKRPSFANVMCCSNNKKTAPVCIGSDNRRCAVFQPNSRDSECIPWWIALNDWIKADRRAAYRDIARFFYERDISNFDPQVLPESDYVRRQKIANLSPVQRWLRDCICEGCILGYERCSPGMCSSLLVDANQDVCHVINRLWTCRMPIVMDEALLHAAFCRHMFSTGAGPQCVDLPAFLAELALLFGVGRMNCSARDSIWRTNTRGKVSCIVLPTREVCMKLMIGASRCESLFAGASCRKTAFTDKFFVEEPTRQIYDAVVYKDGDEYPEPTISSMEQPLQKRARREQAHADLLLAVSQGPLEDEGTGVYYPKGNDATIAEFTCNNCHNNEGVGFFAGCVQCEFKTCEHCAPGCFESCPTCVRLVCKTCCNRRGDSKCDMCRGRRDLAQVFIS
jgi:hypothetical protein